MFEASSKFTPALQEGHRMVTLAQVFSGTTMLTTLPVIGGDVKIDKTASIRRSCSLDIDPLAGALVPDNPSDVLVPFGNEVHLWRGIVYVDGTQELVPLGIFRISDTLIDDTGAGLAITVTGYDRSRTVQRAKLTDVYAIAAGTNVGTAIQSLISSRVSGLTYNFTPTSAVTPAVVQYKAQDDPWVKATELAVDIGCQLYFDVNGVCVLAPEPIVSTLPVVAALTEGPVGNLTELSRAWSDAIAFNDVLVTGESTGLVVPVTARVQDTNSNSPTNVSGPYGDVPVFFTSPVIGTTGQAAAVAAALLQKSLGNADVLTPKMVPDPRLDVDDVVAVTRVRLGLAATPYVIETVTCPLDFGTAMDLVLRRVN